MSAPRRFFTPEIVFGEEVRAYVGSIARDLGLERVLLVSDVGLEAAGWVAAVAATLEQSGVVTATWCGASVNPRMTECEEGSMAYTEARADGVVALGGGSAIDAAKGVALAVSQPGEITDYAGINQLTEPLPPLIAIPTTAGSGSEASQFAMLSHPSVKRKFAVVSKQLIPDTAVLDPAFLRSCPVEQRAVSGIDVLAHAIEAFLSNGSSALTDAYALDAMAEVFTYLPLTLRQPHRADLNELMMLASLKAGLAFSNASLGAVHALAHAAGGLCDQPHGALIAAFLPVVVQRNARVEVGRWRRVGQAMGLRSFGLGKDYRAQLLLDQIERLRLEVGVTGGLHELGVDAEDYDEIATHAKEDPCLLTNPRTFTHHELVSICRDAA